MRTGWVVVYGAWYWLDKTTGEMAAGQALTNGRWSRFDAQGKWPGYSNGWLLDGGSWYWLDPSGGDLRTGWQLVGGRWYWMDGATARMQTGWQQMATTCIS